MTSQSPPRGSAAWLAHCSEVERADGWSLRGGLVRYAQAQPVRAGAVLEVVRRIEAALAPHRTRLDHSVEPPGAELDPLIAAILDVTLVVDTLADELAAWAADPAARPRPDTAVDRCVVTATERLDSLGVESERRDPSEWARVRRRG